MKSKKPYELLMCENIIKISIGLAEENKQLRKKMKFTYIELVLAFLTGVIFVFGIMFK